MSSRTSPALLPDPKRPRLLAPGDGASSPPAVPSAAPSYLTSANYTNRVPGPIQGVAPYGRTSRPTMQTASSRSPPPKEPRPHADPAAGTSYPPSSSASSSLPPRPESSPTVTEADRRSIIAGLRQVMPDIVIAAALDRTPREIQNEIFDLVCAHEHDMATGSQRLPSYTPEDYAQLLKMHRRGESAERITLVLHRTISSVFTHFAKQKPVWQAAGEWVKPPSLRRDYQIDYEKRIKRELAGPAKEEAAKIAEARLAVAPRPTKVNLLLKFGRPTSARVFDSRIILPTAAQTVPTSASAPAPSSTGFSAYSTAASFVPTASISSSSPAPSLVADPAQTSAPLPSSGTESIPTSAPLPVAVAPPPPVRPVLQAVEPAASSAPPTPHIPVPITTADSLDPDASPPSPLSDDDDSPPSLSPRVPNPVPHHAPHLPLLPLWCDGHYEQGIFGLKRFRQLMEDSRSRTRAAAS